MEFEKEEKLMRGGLSLLVEWLSPVGRCKPIIFLIRRVANFCWVLGPPVVDRTEAPVGPSMRAAQSVRAGTLGWACGPKSVVLRS